MNRVCTHCGHDHDMIVHGCITSCYHAGEGRQAYCQTAC